MILRSIYLMLLVYHNALFGRLNFRMSANKVREVPASGGLLDTGIGRWDILARRIFLPCGGACHSAMPWGSFISADKEPDAVPCPCHSLRPVRP